MCSMCGRRWRPEGGPRSPTTLCRQRRGMMAGLGEASCPVIIPAAPRCTMLTSHGMCGSVLAFQSRGEEPLGRLAMQAYESEIASVGKHTLCDIMCLPTCRQRRFWRCWAFHTIWTTAPMLSMAAALPQQVCRQLIAPHMSVRGDSSAAWLAWRHCCLLAGRHVKQIPAWCPHSISSKG